jgi:hypothetical protein
MRTAGEPCSRLGVLLVLQTKGDCGFVLRCARTVSCEFEVNHSTEKDGAMINWFRQFLAEGNFRATCCTAGSAKLLDENPVGGELRCSIRQ